MTPPRKRLPDWPERLAAYLEARRHVPFGWGSNDCVTFAAGAVVAMTGTPLATLLPAVWGTQAQAARALRGRGGLSRACTAALGTPRIGKAAALAGRGAVVCVPIERRATLGIAAGNGHWCAPGAAGLVWRPMVEVRRAWEV